MPVSGVHQPDIYVWRADDANMLTEKAVYFDLDGTLVDLYSVDEWLSKLRSFDSTPYKEAPPIVNMNLVSDFCTECRHRGYRIGIVTWLAGVSNSYYDDDVIEAKLEWIQTHFDFDDIKEIIMSPYGVPKSELVDVYQNAILIDDSEENRLEWDSAEDNRIAYDTADLESLFTQILDDMDDDLII